MRVLLVVHRALPESTGGVEVWAEELAAGLAELGHEAAILSLDDCDEGPLFAIRSQKTGWGTAYWITHRLSAARTYRDTWKDPRFETPLRRVLQEFAPDVIHLGHPDGWGVWPLRLGRQAGAITAATLHDYKWVCARGQMVRPPGIRCEQVDEDLCVRCVGDQLSGNAGRNLLRRLAPGRLKARVLAQNAERGLDERPDPGGQARRRWQNRQRALLGALQDADLVIAPSRFVARRIEAAGLDRPIRILPNGLDVDMPRPRAAPASGPLRLGFFGNPHPTKGLSTLLEAVQSRPAGSVQLLVYGATREQLAALAGEGGVPDFVTAMGAYPPGSAPSKMVEVDAVALPSTWDENHPLVAVEARLAGRPLIVSDRGGLPELVDDGVDGWVLPAGDAASWGERIGLLSTNRSLLYAAQKQVRPLSSRSEMTKAHVTAYIQCGAPGSVDCSAASLANERETGAPR